MANIIFGDYKPTEREELGFSDPNIIDLEWLDENKNPIGTKNINGTDFSNIVYGQKVRIKVKFKNYTDNKGIFISIESNNKKCKFKPKIPMMLVKNNEVLSEPFALPINMYFDEIEEYDYGNHYTKASNPQELYVTVLNTTTFKTEKKHILKPYTYSRNYEELIGLLKSDNSGTKDGIDNYENKFINYNTQIAQIVKAFLTFINDLPLDNTKNERQITDEVAKQAKALWNSATNQVQSGKLDDRPLYWARNKMQTYLKRHPFFKNDIDFEKSLVKPNTKLAKVITIFEEQSRNYKGIDFSKSPAGNKKVLITGFDPFLLNSIDHPSKKYYNILQSNPSGVVALALANDNTLGAYIQVMIFPVRYTDFDGSQENNNGQGEGVVERYIKNMIPKVDMIVTISQKLEKDFDIDAFATVRRGGGDDNMNSTRIPTSKALDSATKEWIETTLPKQHFLKAPKVEVDYSYDGINTGSVPLSINTKVYDGPGGNYLSNEIFYRVAKLRVENNDKNGIKGKLPTGHFHIDKIQDESIGEDLDPIEIKQLLNIVKKALLEGIRGI